MRGGRRMNKLKLVILALIVLLLSSAGVMAQGNASMIARSNKVENTLKTEEKEWVSKRQHIGTNNVLRVWALKGTEDNLKDPNRITYTLYEFATPTEAYEFMHSIHTPAGPGTLTKEFGDETEIWDFGQSGAKIHFRFGSEVVFIGGRPSSEIVKRFARHIADALADK